MVSKTQTFSTLHRLCSCLVQNRVPDRLYVRSYFATSDKCLTTGRLACQPLRGGGGGTHVHNKLKNNRFLTDLSFTINVNKQQTRSLHSTSALLKKDYYKVLGVKKADTSGISRRRTTNSQRSIILTLIKRMVPLKDSKRSKKRTRY